MKESHTRRPPKLHRLSARNIKVNPNARGKNLSRRWNGEAYSEPIGNAKVFTAHRDLPEICGRCGRDIYRGERYVIRPSILHYRCK